MPPIIIRLDVRKSFSFCRKRVNDDWSIFDLSRFTKCRNESPGIMTIDVADIFETEFADECAEKYASFLPHMGTKNVARDMDAVRAALGEEKLNYVGYSYGTSIGAVYADMFPDRIRAMVLDGGTDLSLEFEEVNLTQMVGFERAFDAFARERAQALMVAGSSTYLVYRAKIAALAIQRKLPTMSSYREMVEAGILMGYAVNMAAFVGHSAGYVDRILRGANPADMAIEQPTRFELVVNAKTASAIGLTIPSAILQRADDVIR